MQSKRAQGWVCMCLHVSVLSSRGYPNVWEVGCLCNSVYLCGDARLGVPSEGGRQSFVLKIRRNANYTVMAYIAEEGGWSSCLGAQSSLMHLSLRVQRSESS